MRYSVLILSACLVLTGCIPAAFVVGSAAGAASGKVASDQRNPNIQLRDRNMSQVAYNRIAAAPALKGSNISIATYNGVILMVGQTSSPALRDQAYQLVSTVPYVKRVYNEVTVGESNGILDTSNDDWITTKVKSALVAEKGLKSGNIKVVTEAQVVYLMGLVTPSQAEKAASVASRITGVNKVVKVFEYQK